MTLISKQDIQTMDRIKRANLINSITGIKPVLLIGTIDSVGQTNLAIFSSVFHLGSDPALLGMICRPQTDRVGHTLNNIRSIQQYTLNHIPSTHCKSAHMTSAKWPKHMSEFDACQFTPQYTENFKAPHVHESPLKIGLTLVECTPIKHNQTTLVIGQVNHIISEVNAITESGQIDLTVTKSVSVVGLNHYHMAAPLSAFPYAKVPHE